MIVNYPDNWTEVTSVGVSCLLVTDYRKLDQYDNGC